MSVQWRALLTYINRVYYPYVVREPEIGADGGAMWAFWIHSSPYPIADTPIRVSSALLVPNLEALPAAFKSSMERVHQLGEPHFPF